MIVDYNMMNMFFNQKQQQHCGFQSPPAKNRLEGGDKNPNYASTKKSGKQSSRIVRASVYVAKPIESYSFRTENSSNCSKFNKTCGNDSGCKSNRFSKIQECNEMEELQSNESQMEVGVSKGMEGQDGLNIFRYMSSEHNADDMMKGPQYDKKGKLIQYSILGKQNEFISQDNLSKERLFNKRQDTFVTINSNLDKSMFSDKFKMVNQNVKKVSISNAAINRKQTRNSNSNSNNSRQNLKNISTIRQSVNDSIIGQSMDKSVMKQSMVGSRILTSHDNQYQSTMTDFKKVSKASLVKQMEKRMEASRRREKEEDVRCKTMYSQGHQSDYNIFQKHIDKQNIWLNQANMISVRTKRERQEQLLGRQQNFRKKTEIKQLLDIVRNGGKQKYQWKRDLRNNKIRQIDCNLEVIRNTELNIPYLETYDGHQISSNKEQEVVSVIRDTYNLKQKELNEFQKNVKNRFIENYDLIHDYFQVNKKDIELFQVQMIIEYNGILIYQMGWQVKGQNIYEKERKWLETDGNNYDQIYKRFINHEDYP